MDIFILSSGRPTKQITYRSLPHHFRKQVQIVVPEAEVKDYKLHGLPVEACPVKGIGATRQWVLDNCGDKVVMMDDDLTFAMRREDEPTRFEDANVQDIERMFGDISERLNTFSHVGVATREGGNRNTADYLYTTRMLRILAYRADRLYKAGVRFDNLPVMEDFDVTLQLLRKSFNNIVLNWIVHNQYGSNAAGGCSQYRTLDVQAHAATMLARKHHPFVKVVQKQTKTAWGGANRTDVRIAWKKAFGADNASD